MNCYWPDGLVLEGQEKVTIPEDLGADCRSQQASRERPLAEIRTFSKSCADA